ncbi:alpha/beta hydrolase [Virgibacillus sp. NKC19-3]|uniref:alpha/beta fold hydrolase n=1 Tax=Virgibacillus saliphilus TaxID=2831674 RepID=UPI001C9B2B35|nr:alpha/beta hydrolase [Virgibacillus sp. NKC19-3]MBY7142621.1 alpha/beta hydrolase [Virgibacillus sp. NKC19-3]
MQSGFMENKENDEGSTTITKEYIEINGVEQGIIIESLNQNKPLLLFLHGGPGFPAYPVNKAHGLKLEQYFDVCYWDQRGTGMSYDAEEAKKGLTVEQLVNDTIEVTNYLRNKYIRDKVFILGHSWGSYLGSLVVQKSPELFYAYIGIGQIGSHLESEREAYQFILKTAMDKNDKRAIKRMRNVTFDENYYQNRAYGAIRAKFTEKYGGGFKREGYANSERLRHVFSCPNYTLKERINSFKGAILGWQSLGHVMATADLVELVPKLQLPVFILQGRHDYQTTYTQAKRFYESVEAPLKKMYTFENSSHTPFIEEQALFYKIIQDDILPVAEEAFLSS